jgi:pyruvate,water dikinase
MMKDREVYWLEEIGQEYNDIVGKKSANLAEMLKVAGIQVPSGFAISLRAHKRFINETGIGREIRQYLRQNFPKGIDSASLEQLEQISLALQNIVESKGMPPALKESIASHYGVLCDKCGATDVAVSVRSAGSKSHPGQYETYLNVKGAESVVQNVIKVWSSIYNTRSISAATRQAIPVDKYPPVGVCILKMVPARAAGVCFTVHPTTGDETKALIESNWGLGESVVGGSVTPDKFVVDTREMHVIERTLGHKEKRVIMRDQGVSEEEIPADQRGKLSLSDEEAINIVAVAKKMESHFGVPQDVEWAIDDSLPAGENVILLQTRPQVGIPEKKSATDKIIDMMIKNFRS